MTGYRCKWGKCQVRSSRGKRYCELLRELMANIKAQKGETA